MNLSAGEAEELDSMIAELRAACGRELTLQRRIELCRECIDGVFAATEEWVAQAVKAKGLPEDSPLRAEDLLTGPTVVLRQLRLTMQTLQQLIQSGRPALPGKLRKLRNGQLAVPVFPTSGNYDSLTFMGLHGAVRMQPGVERADIHGDWLNRVSAGTISGVAVVLGAGNVSSIPATDSLTKIMFEGTPVILKMNPVNEYLAPVFERAFASLVRENLLRIVTGGAAVGAALVGHSDVDEVHVTGSAETHDRIVWGDTVEEQRRRRRDDDPTLKKTITSELGNVTPWIIVPGNYSDRQLRSQAEHVAASITNNVSFNCLATKVIVTWDKWPQRKEFLQLINAALRRTPTRPSYYPGANERYAEFSGEDAQPDDTGAFPWCLLEDQRVTERPELFQRESFVCVCAETALSADTPERFVSVATEFVNEQLTGTLCASVTFPNEFRRQSFEAVDTCLETLRYGSVCVNQWSGLPYGFTSPPWGAYPGADLKDVQSGIGNVHNTYLLDHFEKTVLKGPLINFPKPVWFPGHRNGVKVAERLVALYHQPSVWRLPSLFAAALQG